MLIEAYNTPIRELELDSRVLEMIPKTVMAERCLMPLFFDEATGLLTIATSRPEDSFGDAALILKLIQRHSPAVKALTFCSVTYENFNLGYTSHYRQQFVPSNTQTTEAAADTPMEMQVTSEQTKLAQEILQKAIEVGASDIHITPYKDFARVKFRIDGKPRTSSVAMLSVQDEIMISNIYKRNSGLEVNNLVNQDGRFSMFDKDFRLATTPYGDSGMRNKVVLRVIGSSENVRTLDELGFSREETETIRDLVFQPSGILLVCGPTGEGKSTTLYACIKELADTDEYVINTIEDPIEKYIAGVSQSQYHAAENEKNAFTFTKAIKAFLRSDPDVIMVGEIRDKETAVTSVQASQTGHMIFSTLHVRNSPAVFKRLADMGVNVSGFTEQIAGIISQRLLAVSCPHCKKRIVSQLNRKLRQKDLALLEYGEDDNGNTGYISYASFGCPECHQTGIIKRIPILEIISFDNYLRDYFANNHGLVAIEKYLREKRGFKSLWDKGMLLVAEGVVSLEELMSRIPVDIDFESEDFNPAEAELKLAAALEADSLELQQESGS